MDPITESKIHDLLEKWQANIINEQEVHEKAEELWAQKVNLPNYPESDHRSIAIEVLAQLETLNHQLVTRSDIPAIIAFLNTSQGKELKGWSEWRRYWDNLDLELRKKELKDNPYYCI